MTTLATDLAALLSGISRPGGFHSFGTAEILAPGIEVRGVGPVALPLLPVQAEQLVAVATQAPYGRGEQTVVDTDVRRTWQINADQVEIRGRAWARTLEGIVALVAEGLGVTEPIVADLYKLLIYTEGGFFLSHRDTEKTAGMFGTLVIVLPSIYSGGDLVIRHQGHEARLDMACSDPSEAAFAAFYADCEHEVLPVTSGCRLTLIYNLSCREPGHQPLSPSYNSERDRLTARLQAWTDSDPDKLITPLEHAYTPASLSFAALKGADAARAAVLVAAAEQAECDLHLALVTIEESGSAEYHGDYRRNRWKDSDDDDDADFEVVDVFDASATLSDWRLPDGTDSPLGPLPYDEAELSPPGSLDDLVPVEQSFHEATGNEGASFERTYRRAALVLWPRRHRLTVLNHGGLATTLPALVELAQRCGGDPSSPAWAEAHHLSGLMLGSWPRDTRRPSKEGTPFLALLGQLGDVERIDTFLSDIAAAGLFTRDDAEAVARALSLLSPARAGELAERIVTANAAITLDACAALLASVETNAIDLRPAAMALIAVLPGGPQRPHRTDSWGRPRSMEPETIADLLSGLVRIGLADAALDTILAWPQTYDADAVLIPALLSLDRMAPARLREACLTHLRARIAEELAPPADWKRDDRLKCACAHCRELARFLADPGQKMWAFRAVQADRSHVESIILNSKSDVATETLRKGSPHTLVCTKNQASYQRRVQQRQADLKTLARIEG
jgi:predicted 2-oxoglutarate/Fe(II)-dependent dioxygenase YbiX